jgi:hypothetical protein
MFDPDVTPFTALFAPDDVGFVTPGFVNVTVYGEKVGDKLSGLVTVKEDDEFLTTDLALLTTLSEPVNVTVISVAKFSPVIVVVLFILGSDAVPIDTSLGGAVTFVVTCEGEKTYLN